jgi:hypothetical protein
VHQSAFIEKEKYLAARHEGAHVVINAAKGRRVIEASVWLRDDRSYHGVTLVRIFTDDGTEPGHIKGAIGDIKEHFDRVKARADANNAAQQAKIALPIEDELITLAAGIEGEEMIAKERGWPVDNIDENIQAETDIDCAKEIAHKAGGTKEFAILWQSARTAASQLLRRADIREAWDLITELLIMREQIKWENMDEQMIAHLTQLSSRDQLI